jgi:tripartite-type tricarboxylate transporter receptor subunit TctC
MRIQSIVAPMVILAAAGVASFAEYWPTRPMTLVVTFAAGSAGMISSRGYSAHGCRKF